MNYLPQRRSIRWQGYDYSQAGIYFVTVCIERRMCLLANLVEEKVILHESGIMVEKEWLSLPSRFPFVSLDEYIVMPNHFYGILAIKKSTGNKTIGDVVGAWKSLTTNAYIQGVKQWDWPPFEGRLWQRNYYERVVRSEHELNAIREYIVLNPIRWAYDKENPNP